MLELSIIEMNETEADVVLDVMARWERNPLHP